MSKSLCAAVLLGAGLGLRLGADKPKAFVEINGRSILSRSYDALKSSGAFDRFVITVPDGFEDCPEVKRYVDDGAQVLIGGETRRESVARALALLRHNWNVEPTSAYVLIHDAARCFVSEDLVKRTIYEVKKHQAVTTGVPSIDSLKRVDENGKVIDSLPRSQVWCVQTPQAFRFDLILRAHEHWQGDATDDASMVEPFHPVHMILGDRANRKVTVTEDLS